MAVMRLSGNGRRLPPHANVREDASEYVIKLDVSDFTENELTVETLGPVVTVRGDQLEPKENEGRAFCLHERLVDYSYAAAQEARLVSVAELDRLVGASRRPRRNAGNADVSASERDLDLERRIPA